MTREKSSLMMLSSIRTSFVDQTKQRTVRWSDKRKRQINLRLDALRMRKFLLTQQETYRKKSICAGSNMIWSNSAFNRQKKRNKWEILKSTFSKSQGSMLLLFKSINTILAPYSNVIRRRHYHSYCYFFRLLSSFSFPLSLSLSHRVQLIKETTKKIDALSSANLLGWKKNINIHTNTKLEINTLTLLCILCFLFDFFREPLVSIRRHNLEYLSTEGHTQSRLNQSFFFFLTVHRLTIERESKREKNERKAFAWLIEVRWLNWTELFLWWLIMSIWALSVANIHT